MTESAEEYAGLLRAELAEALAADLSERPQRCGHSSDPMCCPYENFPTLAEFFRAVETPTYHAPRYEPCVTDADGNCTRWTHDHTRVLPPTQATP